MVISDHLSKILEACLTIGSRAAGSEYAVICLSTCFQLYGNTCGPFKNKLESYLLKYLDSQCPTTDPIEKAGEAFHFLQQIGSGGNGGINYQNSWNAQLQKICSTIHHLCDTLFEGVVELSHYERTSNTPLDFSPIYSTNSRVHILGLIANRLANCVLFLKAMLQ